MSRLWIVRRDAESLHRMPRRRSASPGPDGDVIPWAMAEYIAFARRVPAMPEVGATSGGEELVRGANLLEAIRIAGVHGELPCLYHTERPVAAPPGSEPFSAAAAVALTATQLVTVSFAAELDADQESAFVKLWREPPRRLTGRTWGWTDAAGAIPHSSDDPYPNRAFLETAREFSKSVAPIEAVCGGRLR